LFDALASLLGVRARVSFEGQAAMELESLAERHADDVYAVELGDVDGITVVRTTDIIRGVVEDLVREVTASRIAARFHATLVDVIVRVCAGLRQRTGIPAVALSGGVFQNAWLLAATIDALQRRGFEVYTHRNVPPNDGGLALGQAAVAARRLAAGDV
jgi:hydrogenase maturation protein HypF